MEKQEFLAFRLFKCKIASGCDSGANLAPVWLPKPTKIMSWRRLEAPWRRLGASWGRLGGVLGRLGVRLGGVLGCLGASWELHEGESQLRMFVTEVGLNPGCSVLTS